MILWILVGVICLIGFYIFFNRNPERNIPKGKNVVSPADGKIIEIVDLKKIKKNTIKIKKGKLGKIFTTAQDITKEGYLISIFMTPFDVHVQRAPLAGKIISANHKKGKFLPVNSLEAGMQNEKNEMVIENKDIGKIKVIQIAGFIARRIQFFAEERQRLIKGQVFGKINLGSQVVLIIPRINLKVKNGDKVAAGETVIAEY